MTALKASGTCAIVSVCSFLVVLANGDGVCPGDLSSCFVFAFFLFALASFVCLIVGLVLRFRHSISS